MLTITYRRKTAKPTNIYIKRCPRTSDEVGGAKGMDEEMKHWTKWWWPTTNCWKITRHLNRLTDNTGSLSLFRPCGGGQSLRTALDPHHQHQHHHHHHQKRDTKEKEETQATMPETAMANVVNHEPSAVDDFQGERSSSTTSSSHRNSLGKA